MSITFCRKHTLFIWQVNVTIHLAIIILSTFALENIYQGTTSSQAGKIFPMSLFLALCPILKNVCSTSLTKLFCTVLYSQGPCSAVYNTLFDSEEYVKCLPWNVGYTTSHCTVLHKQSLTNQSGI